MEVRSKKDGPLIGSATQTLDSFADNIKDRQDDWRRRVIEDPTPFRRSRPKSCNNTSKVPT